MQVSVSDIRDKICSGRDEILKVTFSSPSKVAEYKKIVIRPVDIKKSPCWQAERFKENKVFHLNLAAADVGEWLKNAIGSYAQISVFMSGETLTYSAGKNGIFRLKSSANAMQAKSSAKTNDRQKEYILKEGDNIPALVDLGVFTSDFKIVKSKYDKYKQINRFVELIDDEFSKYSDKDITILDFGCGKSYLTFIVYYYFTHIRNVNPRIIGYDLKADVVADCNEIAKRYGYDNLEFVVSDVSKDVLYDSKIDMIISLHACDTATDYALHYAVQKNVKNIFSVPCCQHEVNSSIRKGGELDIFMKYGIIKERMSVLLTDTVRAMILEDMGYSVDMIEFVDLAHSPKNLMIRAKKTKKKSEKNLPVIKDIIDRYNIKQTLYELIYKQ